MSLYPELDNLTLQELITCFQGTSPYGEDYVASYYSEVASLIVKQGEIGIDFLLEKISCADTARLQAILFALTAHSLDKPVIQTQLYQYLHDERPLIMIEAVDGLRRQGAKEAIDSVLALREHPSPYVRGSVLRFIGQLYPQEAFPILVKALKDPHFIVRENAADELGELGIAEGIPHLQPLLLDDSLDVQQAAQTSIKMLESSF